MRRIRQTGYLLKTIRNNILEWSVLPRGLYVSNKYRFLIVKIHRPTDLLWGGLSCTNNILDLNRIVWIHTVPDETGILSVWQIHLHLSVGLTLKLLNVSEFQN